MKVYRAETGQHIHWSRNLSQHIVTLNDFKQELERCTGVPTTNQILMTSFGTQIKQDQLKEVLEATGKDEYIVFCYDRYYLGASMEEIATLLDVEMPTLEPPVSPLAVSTLLNTVKAISKSATLSHHCEAYLSLFAKFDSYSQLLMKNVSSHTLLAKTMVEEQKAQSMALNVAVTNLETHIQITNQGVQEFYLKAEKELDKQSALLDTTDIDLDILRSIQIHPEFIDHTNNYNAMENVISLEGKTSLMDFVDMDQLQTARQDTQELCQNLANDIQFLRSVVMELKEYEDDLRQQIAIDHDLQTLDTMLMDIQEIRDKAQFLRDKIKRDLNRIYIKIADLLQVPLSSLFATLSLDGSTSSTTTSTTSILPRSSPISSSSASESLTTPSPNTKTSSFDSQSENKTYSSATRRNSYIPPSQDASTTFPSQSKKTLEAFYHLAEIHVNDYLSKLNSYEAIVRQHINKLSQLKRQSIQKFLKNMNTVSQLQSDIAATSPRLDSANKSLMDFKSRYGTSYLETSRDMLFAYGALMIEVLRRKEYASILVENANLIADILGRFREQEEERRNFFRHDIENTLPFKITTINEAAPQFEISTINTYDSKSLITKKDIIDFVSLLDRSYSQAMGNQMNPGTNRPSSKNAKNDRKGSFSTRANLMGITKDSYGQNLLNLLNNMNKQLDGLNVEFLKMVETTFFMGSNNSRIRSAVISTRPEMKDDISAISKISSESSALQLAEDKVKKYEARIQSLEKTLQEYQTYTPPSRLSNKGTTIEEHRNNLLTIDPSKSGSHGSSIFSVLENDMENETGLDTANNGKDKTVTEEQVSKLQQEIANLQETVQQREAFIGKMHEQLLREQQMHQQYQDQSEHDKEDLRLQIQEYEQLLEEERQTYEDNRKSFMREAQIKDNLTDIRIADIETELKTKLKHLTETVEAEQKQKAELGTRHEQELLELKETHKKELAMAIQHVEDNHKVEKSKLEKALETLRQEYMDYRQETTASKQEADEKWNQLVSEMNNSEEARNEIKQRLAQARDMVSRAENDWMEKQEALEKLKSIHDNACTIILGLVTKLNSELTRSLYKREDDDIISLLDILTRELDVVVVDMKDAQQKIGVLENNYNEACQQFEIVNEEKMEWHSLSVHMAQKLDDVRRNIIFEVTNQLQLPVDEDEAGAMTRKIISLDSTTEQQDTSIYNDILMAANVIDSAKFVSKIRKKVRNAHELTRRWQKEYKDLKEKYSKLTNSAHEKIAFRNFKVGDVALFLPTRNSTGKPWAAFNINAPHYFLKPSEAIANQMNSREWIVARITSITECVVNAQDPKTNPYGLSDQLVFYQLEVENWRNARQRHHHKKSRQDKSATASEESSSSATPTTDTTTINPTVQRRYTLPNINNRDIGLASISSSLIEKSPQTGSPTTSISQQTSLPSNGSIPISSSYQQQEQYGPLISTSPPLSSSVASSSRPSPFQFARGASSNIVHSTTVSSPALSGGQDLNHSRRGGTENLNDMSQTGDPTSFSSSIDPSLIWTSGE